MAGRSLPVVLKPLVDGNDLFSDSASSHDSHPSDLDSPSQRAGNGAMDGLADLRHSRRRRSWGIPSLISRQGSRSNLGIDKGISRAHELTRR